MGVNENSTPISYMFCPICIIFSARHVHKNLLSRPTLGFLEDWCKGISTSPRSVNEFLFAYFTYPDLGETGHE
jgi:hypothetical protein